MQPPQPGETGVQIRKTICAICNPLSHCGIDAHVKDGVVVKVEGSRDNPHSAGTLCAKGAASRQYIYHPDRLRHPMMRVGEARFERVSWEEALDEISRRLLEIRAQSGAESVIFFAGYPKWMRPFLKRLAHSFGSPNFCTESSTCSAAASMASRLNYGTVGRPDISKTACLMIWGTNPFYSNTSAVRRLLDARERGMRIIEVGPLLTPVSRHAELHLRLRPGTSGALALGMAHVILHEELYDREFVARWTTGFQGFQEMVRELPPDVAAGITGVPADQISKAARMFATTKPAALMTGANATVHHTHGIQNHRAITALVGLCGSFDREGGNYVVPAAYLYVANGLRARQAAFEQSRPWESMPPRIGEDLFPVWCRMVPEAQATQIPFQIRNARPYPLRAMLAFGLNHRMWPGSDFMEESLRTLEFLVDVDLFMTDTARLADVILPACSSFERQELKLYPEQAAIWTEPVIRPLGESRSDVEIIFALARALAPEDELLQQCYEACLDWIMEPGGLKVADLKGFPGGRALEGIRLPPYRKYEKSGFSTPTGKMELASRVLQEAGLDPLPRYVEPVWSPRSAPEIARDYPLVLTTGARLPMFIHSRCFRLPWMRRLQPDPLVDLNPADAETREIGHGDWIVLATPRGELRVRANLTQIVPPGVVSMYHGYPEADINRLIPPDYRDPISGYPGFKALLCQVRRVEVA